MLEPDGLSDVRDGELEKRLLDRPISSIRDLQYVYGTLFELAVMDESSPASLYRTFEDENLVGKQRLLEIVVNPMGDDGLDVVDVELKRYDSELANKVALCHYDASRGCDHSLTQISSKSGWEESTIENFVGKFNQWSGQDVVKKALTDDWSGINNRVADSILNTSWVDFEKQINDVFSLPTEAGSNQIISTLVFETDEGRLYPGEIEACFEALKQKKYVKYTQKSVNSGSSVGEGVCYITGEKSELVGTMNDPLKHFVAKQQSSFVNMSNNQSWRSHPISFDAAKTISNSESWFDVLSTWVCGLQVYYMPYPQGVMDATDARVLYKVLQSIYHHHGDEVDDEYYNGDVAFMRMYNEEALSDFNVYIIFENYQQSSRRDVFFDEPSGDIHIPSELAQAHSDVIREYDEFSSVFATKPESDKDSLLTSNKKSLMKQVLSGWYFDQTMPDYNDDDPSASDTVVRIMRSILSGQGVDVSTLIKEFDAQLRDEWAEGSDDGSNTSRVPSVLLSQQTYQIESLARVGLLNARDETQRGYTESTNMKYNKSNNDIVDILTTDGMSKGEQISKKRQYDLEKHVENRQQYFNNDERRATWLMGAFIGFVSSRQRREENTKSISEGIPVHQLTKRQLQNTVSKAIEKNKVYSLKTGTVIRYGDLFNAIQESMTTVPTEWQISNEDLRFTFGQGLMYGENYYHDLEYNGDTLIAVNGEQITN